ncbi:MAG: protein translocase subunit SecD, partial [Pseudomonadota bacterium]
MNRYPAWLNLLVLGILLLGCTLALPNLYGTMPAVQLVTIDGDDVTPEDLNAYTASLRNASVQPEAVYLQDGRAVIRFERVEDQIAAAAWLRERFAAEASVASTLAPALPAWVRSLGLQPMSLGLDLRGGVYFLLEVDMEAAIATRLTLYEQSFTDTLNDARIRNRVDVSGTDITVRLRSAEDAERARDIIAG